MLKGEKIILRAIKKDDAKYFFKWLNDSEVTKYLGFHLPINEAAEEKWIEDINYKKNLTDIVFIIELLKENLVIGFCSLGKINYKDRNAECMIVIGEKDYWCRGHGVEVARLLISYAFNQLNLRRIYTGAYSFNKRSIKTLLRIGFKQEGVQREAVFKNGTYHNNILFGILRSEWDMAFSQYKNRGGT